MKGEILIFFYFLIIFARQIKSRKVIWKNRYIGVSVTPKTAYIVEKVRISPFKRFFVELSYPGFKSYRCLNFEIASKWSNWKHRFWDVFPYSFLSRGSLDLYNRPFKRWDSYLFNDVCRFGRDRYAYVAIFSIASKMVKLKNTDFETFLLIAF